MIDIDNATEQQIFDYVVKALLKQGQKSYDPVTRRCCYRDNYGNKCAAGYLISDDKYQPAMENCGWAAIVRDYFYRPSCRKDNLICEMQSGHDLCDTINPKSTRFDLQDFDERFSEIAERYNLNSDVLKKGMVSND